MIIKSDPWKIQSTLAITVNDEEHVIHSRKDNIEVMADDKADQVIEELSESILHRYQTCLGEQMRGNDFSLIMLIFILQMS